MSQILNKQKYKTKNKEEDKEEEPNKTKRDLVFNTHNRTAPTSFINCFRTLTRFIL